MKKIAVFSLMTLMLSMLGLHAESRVVSIQSLTQQDLNELMEGSPSSDLILALPNHTKLPLSLSVTGTLANLIDKERDAHQIEIQKTLYIRHIQGDLLISTDLETWKSFPEFVTGNLSILLQIDDNHDHPVIICGVEAHQRQ